MKRDKHLVGLRGFFAKRSHFWGSIPSVAIAPFLGRDVSVYSKAYKGWAGLIDLLPTILTVAFALSILITILIEWNKRKARPSIRELQDRADRAQELEDLISENVSQVFAGFLVGMSERLELKPDDDSRLTIYVPAKGDLLVRAGRYSTNPNYHQDRGRRLIPTGEGLVSEAWKNGFSYAGDLGEGDKFVANSVKHNLPEETARALYMKSRTVAALRIKDSSKMPVGVLVFESMKPRRFPRLTIHAKLQEMQVFFENSIPSLRVHIPTPDIAKDRGF